jgi:hypothetical protein
LLQEAALLTSIISHLVVVPTDTCERRTTFFQGFSDFWFPDYVNILSALTLFPHDIIDPFLSMENYIEARVLGGGLKIQFLRADLLKLYLAIGSEQNLVIWSTALTVDQVDTVLGAVQEKPLHISTARTKDIVCVDDLNKKLAKDLIVEMISKRSCHDEEMRKLKCSLEMVENTVNEEVVIEAKGHNCTEPMMGVLASCGRQINMTPIEPSGSINEHILGMVELASIIDELRPKEIQASPFRKNDALIHCPSSYTFLYRADGTLWQKINRKLNNAKRNFLKNSIVRNKGYGNSVIQINEEDIFNPYDDEFLGPLLREKQVEVKIFTTVIGLVATNQCIPAYRLPNAVMLHHSKLRAIGQLINSNNKKRREKLNSQFLEYGKAIKENVGETLLESAFKDREKILAVCDLPIEWVALDQLPLMFSHEISRVPSTPGNVAIDTLLSRTKSIYPYSALCNILIIRSFEDGDPIREHLVYNVRQRVDSGRLRGIDIAIVDLSDRASLVSALNAFNGLMVIFDCHGNHGGEEDSAWLSVGGERLDIWHIYQEARVPPIVVLAACSTHPVEGSHASVANGLLESGVQSVIGTFAPVDSAHTATFVIRLLERIAMYLPIALKKRPYTWREIVTGLLRMSYVRDVLEGLRDEHQLLTQEQYEKLHMQANISINMHEDEKWFEKFKASVCQVIGYDQAQGKIMWDANFQFVDTMLFVQLGRPENIVISDTVLNTR